jgi:hypothetical protein
VRLTASVMRIGRKLGPHQQKRVFNWELWAPVAKIIGIPLITTRYTQGCTIVSMLTLHESFPIMQPLRERFPIMLTLRERFPIWPRIVASTTPRLASTTPRLSHTTPPNNASPHQRLASSTPRLSHTAQQFRGNSESLWLAVEACSVSTLRQAPGEKTPCFPSAKHTKPPTG